MNATAPSPAADTTALDRANAITTVDIALREFTRRRAVPAPVILNPISKIDPVCADQLRAVVSSVDENDEGILNYRDTVDLLLDLRQALTA